MRAGKPLVEKGIYQFGGFRLDTLGRVLLSAGRPVSIAPKALDVLIVLVENPGRVVEKEELLKKVWPDTFVEENSLAFNISVLRKILGESSAEPRYIETVPKRGYRFSAEVVAVAEDEPARDVAAVSATRFGWGRAAVGVLVIVAGIVLLTTRFHGAAKFTDKDTLVLADFVNKTGDGVFDGTLRQGLAIELEQSPFLSLISERRVQRTLGLMRQRGEARLTPEVAREVCQRTGSAAVMEGSIASVGSQYVLGLRATNCGSGDILDNEQAQVARKEDVLGALAQLARRFRARAGESSAMLQQHDVPLAEATTASLEALKAYSAAWEIQAARGATDSQPLFKRATELDPEFAMAHAALGRIYADLDQSDLSAESTKRAWELRERTSDREKFFITVNYELLVTGNLEEARKTGAAWVRTYPREAAPHMMLSGYPNKGIGRYGEAAAEAEKALALDPDFGVGYYNVAVNNAYRERYGEAEGALQRAAARGLAVDEFLMLGYDLAFLKNDAAGMQGVAAEARGRPGPESWITNKEAFALAYLGRLRAARSTSQRAVAEAQQGEQRERGGLWEAGAAVREAFYGNAREARGRAAAALALSRDREVEYGAALALAVAGDARRAQEMADDLAQRFPEDTCVRFSYLPVVRAQLALNRHEGAKAVAGLQMATPDELGAPRSMIHALFGALYPIYLRGEAYLALRQGALAAAEFQKVLEHRGIVVSDPIGALAHLQLARALAMTGEKSKAKSAYQDFLTLWKDGDADVPVLKEARAEVMRLR